MYFQIQSNEQSLRRSLSLGSQLQECKTTSTALGVGTAKQCNYEMCVFWGTN